MAWLTPRRLALGLAMLDLAWALQAFSLQASHPASTVSLISLVVWIFLHLPAAALASLILKPAGVFAASGGGALPAWASALMAGLGLAQTYLLSYWTARWWAARRERA